MADDDGNQDDPPEGDEKFTLAQIEDVVRKVLGEMSPGADPELDPDPEGDPEDKAVYSTRQAEEIAEAAVAKAMKALEAKKPKSTPKPKTNDGDEDGGEGGGGKPKGEASPTPPEPTVPAYRARLKRLLVGADD